jgi:hypothetical protein
VTLTTSAEPGADPILFATVFLVKLDERWPAEIDLKIQAVVDGSDGPGQVVRAEFGFDLRRACDKPLTGLYLAYLIVGATVAGPYPFTVEAS